MTEGIIQNTATALFWGGFWAGFLASTLFWGACFSLYLVVRLWRAVQRAES